MKCHVHSALRPESSRPESIAIACRCRPDRHRPGPPREPGAAGRGTPGCSPWRRPDHRRPAGNALNLGELALISGDEASARKWRAEAHEDSCRPHRAYTWPGPLHFLHGDLRGDRAMANVIPSPAGDRRARFPARTKPRTYCQDRPQAAGRLRPRGKANSSRAVNTPTPPWCATTRRANLGMLSTATCIGRA